MDTRDTSSAPHLGSSWRVPSHQPSDLRPCLRRPRQAGRPIRPGRAPHRDAPGSVGQGDRGGCRKRCELRPLPRHRHRGAGCGARTVPARPGGRGRRRRSRCRSRWSTESPMTYLSPMAGPTQPWRRWCSVRSTIPLRLSWRCIGLSAPAGRWPSTSTWHPRMPATHAGNGVVDVVWPHLFGNCHTSRDTAALISESGWVIDEHRRLHIGPPRLPNPVAPHVLGRARRG